MSIKTYLKIIANGISFRPGEFRNDGTMVQKLNPELKARILEYLNKPEPGMIGMVCLTDPVTGKCYSHENILRQKDGFQWNSSTIYMFEKYNVRLSEAFLRLFE